MASLPKEIGRRVRTARERQEMTQAELAGRAEIEEATVRAIEVGRRGLSLRSLVKMAEALHLPPGALLDDADPKVYAEEAEAASIVRHLDRPWRSFAMKMLRELDRTQGTKS